jgi:hypothetical protein
MLFVYAMKTALHFHYAAMTRDLGRAMIDDGAIPEAVRSFSRAMPAPWGPRGRQLTSMQVRT